MNRLALAALAGSTAFSAASAARAGGFEIPDNGTESIGRGGAFVAKASDPTAIQYNPAGLAGQRGTRLLFDGKLVLSDYEFQRAGTYPHDPSAPWGDATFPNVTNTGGPFFAPFVAVTTDLGMFDTLTFAVGVFGPSGVGNRTYPYGVAGAPSPARYDVVRPKSVVAFPTASVGWHAAEWLDVGAGFHFVYGSFDLSSTAFVDPNDGPSGCKYYEVSTCDSLSTLSATGTSVAASAGAILHPTRAVSIGASARTPVSLDATGQVRTDHTISPQPDQTGTATFHTDLPWYFRFGARYAFLDDDGFEAGDVEADGTYETWSQAQGDGSTLHIDKLGPYTDIHPTVAHHYNDTFSVRLGGAYNTRLSSAVLTLRVGGWYDASATSQDPGYTRLDMDTLEKYALTGGIGIKYGGVWANFGYAQVFESSRDVAPGTGKIAPINGAKNGLPVDSAGNPLPAVNEGHYSGSTQIIGFGAGVVFDELFETDRAKAWATPGAPAKHENKGDEKKSE